MYEITPQQLKKQIADAVAGAADNYRRDYLENTRDFTRKRVLTMEKVVKQIEKRIDVLKSFLYTDDEIVYQEIALYKVPTEQLLNEKNLEGIIRRHNARILEITKEYTVIEKSGHNDETEALFEELKNYDIRQFVRSGRVAITKSTQEYVTMFLEEQARRRAEGLI